MDDWRGEFPIFKKHPELVYLDSAATTHKPKSVLEALLKFYAEDYATVHRAIYRSSLAASDQYNETRETVRRFLNAARAEEIVFTRGTTEALNLVALSYGKTHLRPGDEILVSEMEHHSNLVPWQMLAEQTGATLRWMPMRLDGTVDFSGIGPRTKLVAIAHVSNVTGTIHPIAEVAKAAHKVGALLVVDGAQAAPHIAIDVQALGCDFYAFSGHKCYGPTGVGVLYGRQELLASMPPLEGGGDMIEKVTLEKTTYAPPPLRFEAGTPIIASVIALKSALEFIEERRSALEVHADQLLALLEAGLRTIPNLHILGSPPERGPVVTFTIDRVHPLDLATLLDLEHMAIRTGHLCAQPALRKFGLNSAARASLGAYNTSLDIERFIDALKRATQKLTRSQ